jgi:hypothetical protein
MATDKAKNTTTKKVEIPTTSKGFRKSYDSGVVGWQVYLAGMRFFVNVNQYASAVSADKKLIDYSLKGIAAQTKHLADNKIKVPGRLASRLAMALKANHPSYNSTTADYAKGLRKLVDLYATADKSGQPLIKSACKKALAGNKVKATNRLKKRIADMA